jgi:poly-beta-hydroxyalkanoate depolymerase
MKKQMIVISMFLFFINACTEPNTPKSQNKVATSYNNGWVEVSRSSDEKGIWEFNIRSYSENKKYVSIISQITEIKYSTKQVYLERKYVSKRDCNRGVGKIITKNLDGKVLYKNDFAHNGLSVSSGLADSLCYIYTLKHR